MKALKEKQPGSVLTGLFCSSGSRPIVSALGQSKFDFIIFDAEHGHVAIENLAGLISQIPDSGPGALVRVPGADPAIIMRALDLGAEGVVVPQINTANEAILAAQACFYPPLGTRSFGRIQGAPQQNTNEANLHVTCIPMIETAEGLANVKDIASVQGVDAIFIGPIDLSLSLGLEVEFSLSHPALREAIVHIVDEAKVTKKSVGIPIFDINELQWCLDLGIDFITVGSDLGILKRGVGVEVEAVANIVRGNRN